MVKNIILKAKCPIFLVISGKSQQVGYKTLCRLSTRSRVTVLTGLGCNYILIYRTNHILRKLEILVESGYIGTHTK